jgi:hypothetical protein
MLAKTPNDVAQQTVAVDHLWPRWHDPMAVEWRGNFRPFTAAARFEFGVNVGR